MKEFFPVLLNFIKDHEIVSISPYGEGHINGTFLAETLYDNKPVKYILQKINTNLFKNVENLMSNITLVTEFVYKKVIEKGGNPDKECLTLVKTTDGKSYYECELGAFRVYKFIDGKSYQSVENPNQFYQSAVAFGNFANLLGEFDASKLYEIIPNFHNTQKRFEAFLESLEKDVLNRASSVKEEIDFVLKRKDYCSKIVDLLASGKMPTRVTHNDTKLNNVMFDKDKDECIAVIDLDTIMPGSLCYDFGDSIRFGCNHSLEDEKDLSKVNFDLELFDYYTRGYLSAIGENITQIEKDNLAFGSILMTYECGMRFLKDYLDGDVYFRVHREGHNLDRARTQFKLVSDMERDLVKMQEIVNKY